MPYLYRTSCIERLDFILKLFLLVGIFIGFSQCKFLPPLLSSRCLPLAQAMVIKKASDALKRKRGHYVFVCVCARSTRSEEIGPHLKVRAPDD